MGLSQGSEQTALLRLSEADREAVLDGLAVLIWLIRQRRRFL